MSTRQCDPDSGSFTLTPDSINHTATYISKISSSGNFLWAKKIEADNFVNGKNIASDSKGNIYISGSFLNTARFVTATGMFYLSQGSRSFIAKLDSSGSYIWLKGIVRKGDIEYHFNGC